MARPRVILACDDPEAAVKMIGSLNPKRYRVEHIFDLSEALLRAEIVLAHALVIHTKQPTQSLLRQCKTAAERVSAVVVSPSSDGRDIASRLNGRFVPEPFEVADFKRAVYRAVSATEERRHRARVVPRNSEPRALQRVLILTDSQVKGAVMSAVLRNQLSVACEVATNPRTALRLLAEESADCVAAEIEMLMSGPDGAQLAKALSKRGVPVIPVKQDEELDVAEAGQIAWDIVPQVRRALTARDRSARQAG